MYQGWENSRDREGDCSADQHRLQRKVSPGFIDLHQHSDAVPLNNLEPQV